ncbi:hypothetical protein [Paenibacillus fonticola]|uniref:CdiA C-terminal domain-containing protein n=1 Tax=Paenibacillus fonticola TaxID=379896 RepID=UPI0003783CF2|nr:hypothetical protein [Paenibacillus fonticola]
MYHNGEDITLRTLPTGGKPKGKYEKPDPNDPRPKELQNEAADFLASKGYDIKMLPDTKGGNGFGIKKTSSPDFLIDGKAFDCYSPKANTPVRNIWDTVKGKTEKQASRIVINLDDFSGSVDDVAKQFKEYKIDTLEELLIIKDGKVIRLYP